MTLSGQQFGRYRILEQVGQGGMSVVYKGLDTSLEREVAIKVLHPHLAGSEESRKRLEREAKAVARLHHPNILEVYDYAHADAAEAFIVTEYIRGQTLKDYFQTHPFQLPEIAALAVYEIASALAHAHASGVIHRDLKPENIMVREDGALKLMDFGIAKIIDRDDKMTVTGALVGSPAHMAPEIIEGEETTTASDIFSLGTILYLFVTGQLPFSAPNTTATLRRILDGVFEDPRQKSATVSDDLAGIIAKCLRRLPSERFENAAALRDALGEYLHALSFQNVADEWQAYFKEPSNYIKNCLPRMSAALYQQSEKWIQEQRPAKALSCLNQMLAIEPQDPRAIALLSRIRKNQTDQRRNRQMVAGIVGAATLTAFGAALLPWIKVQPKVQIPSVTAMPLAQRTIEAVKPSAEVIPAMITPPVLEAPQKRRELKPQVPAVRVLDVIINVRPWGRIQVEKAAASSTEKARHTFRLKAGTYNIIVSCDTHCVEGGERHTLLVEEGGVHVFNLPAPLKPSRLKFEGFPDEALVSVGTTQRRIRETRDSPIEVVMPQGGSPRMGHWVLYEVTMTGRRPFSSSQWVAPGTLEVIKGNLE